MKSNSKIFDSFEFTSGDAILEHNFVHNNRKYDVTNETSQTEYIAIIHETLYDFNLKLYDGEYVDDWI